MKFLSNTFSKSLLASAVLTCAGAANALTINVNSAAGTATLNGIIESNVVSQINNLVANHPNVRTLILGGMDGSDDDTANLRASAIIRQQGFDTVLLANSAIASGAVDMFLAGNTRTIHHGAKVGIHSWAGNGEQGSDLLNNRNHPSHRPYLDYYRDMGINSDFYWLTLRAAPGCAFVDMTEHQLRTYGLATNYIGGNGGNANEPEIDEMVSGQTKQVCQDLRNSFTRQKVEVPAGASRLEVRIRRGSGDADLYVRRGQQPTGSSYNCRPYRDGNSETCTFNNPQAGTWHIGVRAYRAFSKVRLSVQINN